MELPSLHSEQQILHYGIGGSEFRSEAQGVIALFVLLMQNPGFNYLLSASSGHLRSDGRVHYLKLDASWPRGLLTAWSIRFGVD